MKRILFAMMCVLSLSLFGCGSDEVESLPKMKPTTAEGTLQPQGVADKAEEDDGLTWKEKELKKRGLTSGMTMREHLEAAKNRKDKVVKY
ncbi:MAG: hypothetical protein JEY71_10315 [Sphaerochaeta sp.]|nr:hypothetical protein [Sphaerochaeta sp.]